MYYAVAKFVFERDDLVGNDKKELHGLVDKVRHKFKVCVKPSGDFQKTGEASIVVAALQMNENELHRELDAIAEFCENSGFGRIETEFSIIEHVDTLEADD